MSLKMQQSVPYSMVGWGEYVNGGREFGRIGRHVAYQDRMGVGGEHCRDPGRWHFMLSIIMVRQQSGFGKNFMLFHDSIKSVQGTG